MGKRALSNMGTRRMAIEQQSAADDRNRTLFRLWIAVACSGLVGLVGFFGAADARWPRPFAFGWFAVFVISLVIEIRRRRRAAQLHNADRRPLRDRC